MQKLQLLFMLWLIGIVCLQAQKKKVAVYVSGIDGKNFVTSKLTTAITNSSEYTSIERNTDFLTAINTEIKAQQSGSVADNQITQIGARYGCDFVCAATVFNELGGYIVSVRLINTKTTVNDKSTQKYTTSATISELDKIMNEICQELFASSDNFASFNSMVKNSITSSNANTLTFTVGGVSFEMVKVEAGSFVMGCTSEQSDCDSDESPTHRVTLSSDYYMGKYEVTQKLWRAVMGDNPSNFKGCDNCPVEMVSWEDCQDFLRALNRMTGKSFKLPTEAQWEYAARGGRQSSGTKFAGGYSLSNVGWYTDNSGSRTHEVGTKLPNELGIYDMSGNVYEWCSDWKGDYSSSSQTDPAEAYRGSPSRVLRGGSWGSASGGCRVAFRNSNTPSGRDSYGGFRPSLVQ